MMPLSRREKAAVDALFRQLRPTNNVVEQLLAAMDRRPVEPRACGGYAQRSRGETTGRNVLHKFCIERTLC